MLRNRIAGLAAQRWCETNRVDYVFGLARNPRLVTRIATELAWAEDEAERDGRPARRFADFRWTTLDSWSRRRRVVAKAEWMPGRGAASANPVDQLRCSTVVTSLKVAEVDARTLYEDVYCARGEMENRIKECQLDLFADPGVPTQPAAWGGCTSAATLRANQLRLWFASMAYVLLTALRRIALAHTELEKATCGPPDAKRVRLPQKPPPALRGRWPPEAPEDRCPGHEKCPAHQDRHGLRLSDGPGLPPRPRAALSLSAEPSPKPARQQRCTETSRPNATARRSRTSRYREEPPPSRQSLQADQRHRS